MGPALFVMINRRRPAYYGSYGSYGRSEDRIPKTIALVLLAIMLLVGGWKLYDETQWRTVGTSNVWLRVAKTDGAHRFRPTLVDDTNGTVFDDRIGSKRCSGGPAAMPLGAQILAGVDRQIDRRDGGTRYVLDTRDLARRYC
jgi:hypothetical protein